MIQDRHGRSFPYLRLSVTDVCNFKCTYCLPDGYKKPCLVRKPLSVEEIRRLIDGFSELGVQKVRLTGGEPTVRKDIDTIAQAISAIPAIKTLAITTNAYCLDEKVTSFYKAGIRRINISIDSLKPNIFHKITGHDHLKKVLNGVEMALNQEFEAIKVNTVLLQGINVSEMDNFFDYVKFRPLEWRFIELMSTSDNTKYFKNHHIESSYLSKKLLAEGWKQENRGIDAGPALVFSHPDYLGKIGLIQPYRSDFCDTCNRLRVSAYGELQLCLFGEGRYDLRPLLQKDKQKNELKSCISKLLNLKPPKHYLHESQVRYIKHFSSIGG
ncbi:MAG: GTP 3',8-cyclase MoaA [Endozoicomonadaceae bacterium]|nr:GTP 3',8-cyclase MoaA [Endozoicomonadaceae bacterium]